MKDSKEKKLGLISISFLGLNMIVGPGIFLLPQKFFSYSQGAGLWPFILMSIMALGLAMCFAELSGRFDSNGGPYLYAKVAFGEFVGLQIGLLKWFIGVVVWATLSCALGEILGGNKFIPVITIWALALMTAFGPKWIKLVNSITTIAKMIPLILFIVLSPKAILAGASMAFPTANIEFGTSSLLLACIIAFYGFSGLESIGVVCEQMENPRKNIPKALICIIIFIAFFYIAIQCISLYALGSDISTTSRPIEMSALKLWGPGAQLLIKFSSIMATIGITFVCAYLTPFSLSTISQDMFVPDIFCKMNKSNVPVYSLLLSALLASIFAFKGNFAQLAILSVVGRLGQYFVTSLAVIKMRKMFPESSVRNKGQYIMPGGYTIPFLISVFSLVPLVNSSSTEFIACGLFFLSGIPLFYFKRKKSLRNSEIDRLERDMKHFLPMDKYLVADVSQQLKGG